MSAFDSRLLKQVKDVRVLVAGSLNYDLILTMDCLPENDGTTTVSEIHQSLGGHGGNCASAVATLGAKVTMIGSVGDDGKGHEIRDDLSSRGVDVSALKLTRSAATGFVAIPQSTTYRSMMMYRGANDVDEDWPAFVRKLPLATYDVIAMLDPSDGLALALLDQLGEMRRTRVVWAPGGIWAKRAEFRELCNSVHSIILNSAEYEAAFGRTGPVRPDEPNAPRLIMTDGSRGAWIISPGGRVHVPTIHVDAVDATGAGDAFVAAYCALMPVAGLDIMTKLRMSAAAGAVATTAKGARAGHARLGELMTIMSAESGSTKEIGARQ